MAFDNQALHALHGLANADVMRTLALARSTNEQVHRRSFVRAVFAAIEALTYVLKQRILQRSIPPLDTFSVAALALLREETYALDNKAQAYARPQFLGTAENWRFTVALFVRDCNTSFVLDVAGKGWQDLRTAVDIRNRIVHPKSLDEMAIADAEMDIVLSAFDFVTRNTIAAALSAVEGIQAENATLQTQIDRVSSTGRTQ